MKMFYKAKSIVGIIIAVLFSLVCLFDVISINTNVIEYKAVYHIGENAAYWKYKSVENFQLYYIGLIVIAFIYITFNLLSFIYKNKKVQYILLSFEIIVIVSNIIDFYFWYKSGFDH